MRFSEADLDLLEGRDLFALSSLFIGKGRPRSVPSVFSIAQAGPFLRPDGLSALEGEFPAFDFFTPLFPTTLLFFDSFLKCTPF